MPGLEQRTIGNLNCLVYTTSNSPDLVAVISHGFGAPGDDLVPLGAHLLRFAPELLDRVLMVFPAAPLNLSEHGIPGGRAWWMLDMEELQQAISHGEFRDLRQSQPPGLIDSRNQLVETIEAIREETSLPWDRVALLGFSQGGMLSTEVAFSLEESPAGLVVWSGTLINEAEWLKSAPRREHMPMLQSHGQRDMVLPFQAAQWLRSLAISAGINHQWLPFNGGHEVPYPVLQETARFLVDLLNRDG
ncbi:MAG: dienelactone hydrolase family protein [Planctomycetaceae bacterium]|nr:dienelactone hydrolase family protein [Planctomycetaceae bacterium]